MKNMTVYKFMTAFILGVILVPGLVFAAHTKLPVFSLLGTSTIASDYAKVSVSFDSADAEYTLFSGEPRVFVEYENVTTGERAISAHVSESNGSRVTTFHLKNLLPETTYAYHAVMLYEGNRYESHQKTFTTLKKATYTSSISTTSSSTHTTTSVVTTPVTTTTTNSVTQKVNITAAIESKIKTGGGASKNGVGIAITDEQARVEYGDRIDFTITYQNARTTSLKNVEIVVVLPEQYEFVKSSTDLTYNEKTNTVSYNEGILAAKKTTSFTFTARAVGAGNDDISTTAYIYYEGGKLSATDRDAYSGRATQNVLGASVFGAGFFPQTFLGWLLIIVIITLVIITARRYTKTPVASTDAPEQKNA